MARVVQLPGRFAAAFVFDPFSFVRLHSPHTRMRHHGAPRTVQQCNCCNGRVCNTDMVVLSPS